MSSTDRLSPFSFAILVLVGEGGAGPHDLRRMSEQGRGVYWDAAPSQFYAEPKRLAELGYLEARKEPGRTRERTRYTLTAKGRVALEEWVRTPAVLPRIQNEAVVRLLAADIVDRHAVIEGLSAMRAAIDDAHGGIARSRALIATLSPERRRLLELNHVYAERYLDLQREWLADAERALDGP